MAPVTEEEVHDLKKRLREKYITTPWACSSLSRVSGGQVNLIFRGVLIEPQRWAKTVIFRYSGDFYARNRNAAIHVGRWTYEVAMLASLEDVFDLSDLSDVVTPRLYHTSLNNNIQIQEDFPDTVDLKSGMFTLEPRYSLAIGVRLGSWLRSFHKRASATELRYLRGTISLNQPMRDLKFETLYDKVMEMLENFPDIVEDATDRACFCSVVDMARQEFTSQATEQAARQENWGIIHGDFWTGNVLLGIDTAAEEETETSRRLVVVDWEFAQIGHRAYDLGQMIGDLFERSIFRDRRSAIASPMMLSFINGYGQVNDDLAFRTAIHAGVYLICCYFRRGRNSRLNPRNSHLPSPYRTTMEFGRDLVVRGWMKDKHWFLNGALEGLFRT